MAGAKILSCMKIVTLEKDVQGADGSILIPKGTAVILVPQTMAEAVLVEDGKTLAELWNTLSKTDHSHEGYASAIALTGHQEELTRLADRTFAVETRLAELLAWAASEHGFKPSH